MSSVSYWVSDAAVSFCRWEILSVSEKRVCLASFLFALGWSLLLSWLCLSRGPLNPWGSSIMICNQTAHSTTSASLGLLVAVEVQLKEEAVWPAQVRGRVRPGWKALSLNIHLCHYLGRQCSE